VELDDRKERLEKLAEAISDRIPVDWDLAAQLDPENSDSFDALRTLEALAAVHGPLPEPASEALLKVWGPLEIRAKIGEGAFGEVYRAFDPALEVEVALKLVHADRANRERATLRFLQEARKLAKVRHPNVLVVHGAETHGGRAGMWTELVRGRTLEQRIVQDGRLGSKEAALIGIDLCKALAAVHAAGLTHRDVKTHNVMQEEGGRIVLMDFGSAGVFSPDATPRGEGAYGTPLTVAPEVLRGQPAQPANDLYSLGVLLYRLVTRRYPVEASTLAELMQKQDRRDQTPLRELRPDLPTGFVQVVERAIDLDPSRRFSSAAAFERALAHCLDDARAHGLLASLLHWFGSRPIRIAYAGAALAAAVVAVLYAPSVSRHVAPSGALTASAMLYRQRDNHGEPLVHGGRVSPGDTLYMELEGSEPMNVYVLDEDETGKVFVLFPLPGIDVSNPLSPNTKHRLPGTRNGVSENWLVTSAGGSEDVSVIASRQPLQEVEAELARMPRAEPGAPVQYTELSQSALEQTTRIITRGIGGTVETKPPPGEPSLGISEILSKIAQQPDRGRDIWVWQTRLSNPAPDQ
jgi:serine/threonine protein kinase